MAFSSDVAKSKKELRKNGINSSKTLPVAGISLASVESLSMPLVQEIVLMADMKCYRCQTRVADIISRMNAETESVVVDVLSKKVTLTCRLPKSVGKVNSNKVAAIYRNPLPKIAAMKWILHASED